MQKFYDLSKRIRPLKEVGVELQNTHLYRLSFFVDQSDKGFECTYAKRTVQHVEEDKEALLAQLKDWRRILDEVVEGLEGGEL